MAAHVPQRVFWQLPSCFMLGASQPDRVNASVRLSLSIALWLYRSMGV